MSTHTPGPWEVARDSDPDGGLWIESDGAAIAHLSIELSECGSPVEANAELIAQAPIMIELLGIAKQYLQHPDMLAIPFAIGPVPLIAKIERLEEELT